METLQGSVGWTAGQQDVAEIQTVAVRAVGEDHRFHADFRIGVSYIDGDRAAISSAGSAFGNADDQIHAAALVGNFAFVDVGE